MLTPKETLAKFAHLLPVTNLATPLARPVETSHAEANRLAAQIIAAGDMAAGRASSYVPTPAPVVPKPNRAAEQAKNEAKRLATRIVTIGRRARGLADGEMIF